MCVGTVGQVTERSGDSAIVLIGDRKTSVNAALCPEAQPGDYVIVQTGLILDIITEAEALELERYDRELEGLLNQDAS